MAKVSVTKSKLDSLANAVAAKSGESIPLTVDEMTTAVLSIDTDVELQSKTIIPTESSQTITADNGYDGLSSVQVGAISSTYIGSEIVQRSSTDLSASGDTVTVPSGYYGSQATKSVASGTAGTPSASKGTVNNNSVSVTPSVTNTTGYITGGTKTGTAVTVSASELVSGTYNVTSSGTKDVTNYASASVPSGTEGTPTATKGTVSNNSISVTPSVTNTGGYITGSTKTGTAVSVSASELVSGTYNVSASGTADVTNYENISVPSGTAGTPTATKGTASNGSITVTPSVTNTTGFITGSTKTGTAVTVSASELDSGTKSITANGTGIDVVGYASVDVSVSGGGGSATLITKNITENGTYSAEDDDADGYSSVIVNVLLSKASSWTKVAETSYQISTTDTSGITVATWATDSSDLWTSSKWVYVRIRDTAGKREGYYYGGDQFFYNIDLINGTSSTYVGTAMSRCMRYSEEGKINATTAAIVSLYGVYVDRLYSNGDLRIRARYHSSNSLTIDGTFKVEVYLLNSVDENITDNIVVKSRDSDGYPTELDYYNSDGIVPAYTFCNTRSTAVGQWCYGHVTKINLKGSSSFKVYSNAFRGMYALTDPDFSKITELVNNGSNNRGDQATFQACGELLTVNAPNLTGGLPVYCFYNCKKLVSVYLPKINAINGYSNNRGSFGVCSALTTCEFGSVGYPILYVHNYAFHSCTAIETMTFYAKSDYVDTLLANVRNCVTTGTIIIKASEATTYGGTSYAAGDTIVTSTP